MKMTEDMLRLFAEEKISFVKRAGLKLIEARPGYVKCLMPAKGNENHIGTMYAGALYTLAEIPGGIMALVSFEAGKFIPVLKGMNIQYLKPAKGDITFETFLSDNKIRGIAERGQEYGKADFSLTGDLKDSNGVVVAKTEGVYQIRAV